MWDKKKRHKWELNTGSLEGEASMKQVEGGYKIFFIAKEKEFGMQLRKRQEFFESKKEAKEELKKEMKEFQAGSN